MLKSILAVLITFWLFPAFSQHRDSTMAIGGITRDTFYIIHENIPEHKLWGNSWYTGLAYNLSYSHEFSANFGRTYGVEFGSGGGFNFRTYSWGIGYSYYRHKEETGQIISVFAEVSNFYVPPATARIDYLYDLDRKAHYLRPAIGLSFFAFDLLYNYSFLLSGTDNRFKHGFTIRLKYYLNHKNWEKHYPNHC